MDELLKPPSREIDKLKPVKKKKDPLAPYRDRHLKNLCSGCEYGKVFRDKESACQNCIVTAMNRGDAQPEPEEAY